MMKLFRRIQYWLHQRKHEADLAEEMDFHRAMLADEGKARAMGNATLMREESRAVWIWPWLESVWQDLRYGARQLRRSPGFAVVAILSLALGIGGNTAIFQLLDAVRLRSLPIRNPQELAEVRIVGGNRGMGLVDSYEDVTRPVWQQIRGRQQAFSGVFAWGTDRVRIGRGGDSRNARELLVSGDFFRVLGVRPWRGRLILPEDEGACPSSRAVVSYAYWQSTMGGREIGAGGKLLINGELYKVIGVTPPEFFGLAVGESFDIALPFCQPKELSLNVFDVTVMGRLRPGWTLKRATAELDALSPGIFEATALTGYSTDVVETYKHFRLAAYTASAGVSWVRDVYNSSLSLLLAITGLVLLIACANLANLTLARASTREREMAVRLALGASRGRLMRQLLSESGLLAAAGVALGIGLAELLSRVLASSLSTESDPVELAVATDWRVLLFAAAAGVLTCAVFGALPALRATNTEPVAAMKAGGRGMTGSQERFSLRRLMVITQISVSLVLLVGALLFVRSFRNLMTFDPGMREAGITIANIGFQQSRVPPGRYEAFQRQLLNEVRSTPGILGAATTTHVPLIGGSWAHQVRVGSVEEWSMFTAVSPGYFQTMGIRLLEGRDFDRNDTQSSQRVAVVNQTFIRQFLGGADPIGKTLRTIAEPDYPSTVYEIAGVIADTKYSNLRDETPPMTFAPASQYPERGPWTAIMIYSNAPAAMAIAAVKHTVAQKHPEIVMEFTDFQTRIRDGMTQNRLMAMLSGFFGLLAVTLAVVGLYGVISYVVARRRNEIGIRLALGASRGHVVRMVMREAVWLLLIGLVTGTALSLAAGRSAGSLLFGLKPYDPLTLAAAGVLLAAVASLASFLPARRASRLDPMEALRDE
jgi:putative ABC transport system permease protein